MIAHPPFYPIDFIGKGEGRERLKACTAGLHLPNDTRSFQRQRSRSAGVKCTAIKFRKRQGRNDAAKKKRGA